MHTFLNLSSFGAPDKRARLLDLGFAHILPVTFGPSSSTVNKRAASNLCCSSHYGFGGCDDVTGDSLSLINEVSAVFRRENQTSQRSDAAVVTLTSLSSSEWHKPGLTSLIIKGFVA